MPRIAIVTDSTSSMPPELIEEYGIHVVPQVLNWAGESLLDGIDISTDEFYRRLPSAEEIPTTSQPTIADFKSVFEELHEQGQAIVAICLSHKLSGTLHSARQAEQMVSDARIEIIDSYSVGMGLGYQVLAAARAAEGEATIDEIVGEVERARDRAGLVFALNTLEFLHRGGRIGSAARLLGTALNLKPILEIIDGAIEPIDRVRTRSKATERLLEIIEDRVEGKEVVQITFHHTGVMKDEEELGRKAHERLTPTEFHESILTPVLGTHAGPGVIAIAYCTEE